MRYLGNELGYYPRGNSLESFDVDWAIDTFNDTWKYPFFVPFFSDTCSKEEVAERVRAFTTLSKLYEKKLGDGRKWLGGDKISIADFIVGSHYHSVVFNKGVKHASLRTAMKTTIEDTPQV